MVDIYHTPDWGLSLPTLYFDGATPVNENIGGFGWSIEVDNEEVAFDYGKFKTSNGSLSSHYAEFVAVSKGLEAALDMGYQKIQVKGDNREVIGALNRNRMFDDDNVQQACDLAHRLYNSFPSIRKTEWIRRELNQRADELANRGLTMADTGVLAKNSELSVVEIDPVAPSSTGTTSHRPSP